MRSHRDGAMDGICKTLILITPINGSKTFIKVVTKPLRVTIHKMTRAKISNGLNQDFNIQELGVIHQAMKIS